jgi:multidrug efflux pump subunit AcrB
MRRRYKLGIAGSIAKFFIRSKLTPILGVAALCLGFFAVFTTPREEEPQIVVPMIDILVPFPGGSAKEINQLVTKPLEKLMWEIPGVEYVYSYASNGYGMTTVRFFVGTDPEYALVRLYSKVMSEYHRMPIGAMNPIIKEKSINDVPIVAITLYSDKYKSYEIRRIAEVVEDEIKKLTNVSETFILGSESREYIVYFNPAKLNAYHILLPQLVESIRKANISLVAGDFDKNNYRYELKAGKFFKRKKDIENLIVTVYKNKPIYLKDIATVVEGEGEVDNYVQFGYGPQGEGDVNHLYNAVTVAAAKKKGSNAVVIANEIEKQIKRLEKEVIPDGIHVKITRNYGETSQEKAIELIEHLLIATLSVVLLIAVTLGWKEALIVAFTVPVTLSIALFLSEIYGFTLNRVTLFALIFAIGILVDDAIVVIENIHRWFEMGKYDPEEAAVRATDEVGNPTILATFTVIIALMPMAFVSGMMGPYMKPIPINASVAMFFSMLVAFIITPYMALRLLKREPAEVGAVKEAERAGLIAALLEKIYMPLFESRLKRWLFLGGVMGILGLSILMLVTRVVLVKTLPYDNKSELFVVLDMPEGTTLENTYETVKKLVNYIKTIDEVKNYVMYVGVPAPFDFNGLVRHYYLREEKNLAMIKINLVNKHDREQQSHQIAERIRPKIVEIAKRNGAKYVAVVEPPPGPPVLSPIVAEVYGPDLEKRIEIGYTIKAMFENTNGIVDVGIYDNIPQRQYRVRINSKMAKRYGVTEDMLVKILRLALSEDAIGLIHKEDSLYQNKIVVRLQEKFRNSIDNILSLKILTPKGTLIPLRSLVYIDQANVSKDIYRKNLQGAVYVIANVDDSYGSPVYPIIDLWDDIKNIETPDGKGVKQLLTQVPKFADRYYVKWDGEWQVTYETFRDMGIAFAIALVGLYILLVGWFKSFSAPLVLMSPIPFTLIGIVPGHWLMGAFFTATSMIGFIALAGIILRNSILVVEFAEQRLKQGYAVEQALLEAGIIRTRPIILTAGALIVGAFVIIFDPIFNGLAISLIFGTFASTLLSLVVVPLLYYMMERERAIGLLPAVPLSSRPKDYKEIEKKVEEEMEEKWKQQLEEIEEKWKQEIEDLRKRLGGEEK